MVVRDRGQDMKTWYVSAVVNRAMSHTSALIKQCSVG